MTGDGAAGVGAEGRGAWRELVLPDTVELPRVLDLVPGAAEEVRDEPVTFRQLQHDTADLRLARWGADLRVRLDGPDAGWRLVLPPDDDSGEPDAIVLPAAEEETGERVPAELLDLVRALVRDAVVEPVAEVRTTRTTVRLIDEAGRDVAAVHDDRVVADVRADGSRRQRRVRIVVDGPSPDARRVVARLVHAVRAAVGDTESGSVVDGDDVHDEPLLGVRAEGPPDVVVPRRPGRKGAAGEVLTYALALHVRALLRADVAVRRDRPDAVHRLRVAARTLRSALRTFTPLCDEEWAAHLRGQLAVAADALGAVRDTEVLYARLEEDAHRLAAEDRERVLPALDALLRPRLLAARAAALEELRSTRYLQLLVDLVEAVRHPRLTGRAAKDAVDVLPDLVLDDWTALKRAVRELRSQRLDPRTRAWHRARIRAKRARYGAEVMEPSLRGGSRRWAQELSALTDLLGALHDGVVAGQALHDAAAGSDGPTGFALGRLLAIEDAAVDAAAAEFLRRWPRVRRTLDRHRLG